MDKYNVYEIITNSGEKESIQIFLGETMARSCEEAVKNVKYRNGIRRRNIWYEDLISSEVKHEYKAYIQ